MRRQSRQDALRRKAVIPGEGADPLTHVRNLLFNLAGSNVRASCRIRLERIERL